MSARWALLIVFALAAYGARADLGHKSFTPVIPVGPLAEERAKPVETAEDYEPLTRDTASEVESDLNTEVQRERRAIRLDGEE
jgi:hypothetical protein